MKKIVILGGGFGGTYTFKELHKHFHNDPDVQIILVNKTNYFLFTPLLHEVATGGVLPHHVVEPIRKVLGCCLADLYVTKAKGVNLNKRTVYTESGKINYDYLVMALGSQPNLSAVPGADKHCFTLKTLDDAQMLKRHFIRTFEKAQKVKDKITRERMLRFVIIGGGPTGIELAAEMAEFFEKTMKLRHVGNDSSVEIILIQKNKELLPQFSNKLRRASKDGLLRLKVVLKLATGVARVKKDSITLENGQIIATSTVVWAGGVKSNGVVFTPKIKRTDSGKLEVNYNLQLRKYENVFVVGDMAWLKDEKTKQELPALAQVATQQAKTAAFNIKQKIEYRPMRKFVYQHKGYLLSLGRGNGIGEIGRWPVKGQWVWWVYRTVYLSKLLSWQKKVKVLVDWIINIFSPRDISEV